MAVSPPVCDFGWPAPNFALPATDGRTLSLSDLRGAKGTLVMFLCNHCPYVQAVLDRIIRDARDLGPLGIGVAAICANDGVAYPEDSFANMVRLASEKNFPFPYLQDESQDVARAWGAVCTPDFYGFDAQLGLQYRGRLDASGKQPGPPQLRRDLYEAMKQVAETGKGPAVQVAGMGCSIKWKAD